MRNLNNKDLFTIMRIMRKANIKEELLKMKMPKNASDQESGILILFQFIEAAPNAEEDIFKFLADIGQVDVKALEEDEFDLLPKIISHLQGQKKLVDFLGQALKSVN